MACTALAIPFSGVWFVLSGFGVFCFVLFFQFLHLGIYGTGYRKKCQAVFWYW